MAFMGESYLFDRGSRTNPPSTAIEADMAGIGNNRLLINIVNDTNVHVVYAAVIEELIALPVTARISRADVAESIIDSTVEANFGPPVARIPDIKAVRPAPVSRRPEETHLGRFNPCAWHPEIPSIIGVAPVSWRPNVSGARTNRLRIYGKSWRSDSDREQNLSRGGGKCRSDRDYKYGDKKPLHGFGGPQRAAKVGNLHSVSPRNAPV